jgi:hypothetical protein
MKKHKFTWGKLKHLLSLMEDKQLSEEVLLFDGFSSRFIEVECAAKAVELSPDNALSSLSNKVVLFGAVRKE